MEKEFVPYEQALELKELGFDEPCLAYYTATEVTLDKEGNKTNFVLLSAKRMGELVGHGDVKNNLFKWLKDTDSTHGELYVLSNSVTAPLYQQAFRWFREKYDLVIEPCVPFQRLYSTEEDHFEILEFGYRIYSFDQFRGGLRDKIEWDGYDNSNEEEAELECLKKLIEMCKNHRN